MIYHPNTPLEAVTLRKEHADTAVYLAGGTENLRLHSPNEGKDFIDISALGFDKIEVRGDKVCIGALCTLQQVSESELVPDFIRQACRFCASFVNRGTATVGGNIAARRQDSYLAAALTAAEAVLYAVTPHGEEEKKIGEYLPTQCMRLIEYVIIDKNRSGSVRRFGNTKASHATVIAAESQGVYALSVHGSDMVSGSSADIVNAVTYADDFTGGADYKKYLAAQAFSMMGR